MDLFVRESGVVGAPAIVFLHGGEYSGRSWQPVVDRTAGAPLSCSRPAPSTVEHPAPAVRDGREPPLRWQNSSTLGWAPAAHVVGLFARGPSGCAVAGDRAKARRSGGAVRDHRQRDAGRAADAATIRAARPMSWSLWFSISRNARHVGLVQAKLTDHRADMRLMPPAQIAHIVSASVAWPSSTCGDRFHTVSHRRRGDGLVHRSAATLALRMPNGVDRVAPACDTTGPCATRPLLRVPSPDGSRHGPAC